MLDLQSSGACVFDRGLNVLWSFEALIEESSCLMWARRILKGFRGFDLQSSGAWMLEDLKKF